MYTDFFGLDEKPFRLKPNPRFFYSNAAYEKAYSSILSNILERKGFIILAGEAGTGKTALIRKCIASLDSKVRFIFFPNSILSFEDILDQLCNELGLSVKAGEYFNKARVLESFLVAQTRAGKTYAVLIDDAQNLGTDILHNLRSLSRSPRAEGNLLQFILVGLPELRDKLSFEDLIFCSLEPLKSQEIGEFINQQLSAVGCKKSNLFTSDSIRLIAAYSKGIPRSICALCDSALFIASLSQKHSITPEIVEEAAQNYFLTEGMALTIRSTEDNIGRAANRSAASKPMPMSFSQTASDLNELKTNLRPNTSNLISPERQQALAVGDEIFNTIVRPSTVHSARGQRTNRLSMIIIVTVLLLGSGELAFHYQLDSNVTNILIAVSNWLNKVSAFRQSNPNSGPTEAVVEKTPTTSASLSVPLPVDTVPQTSAPVIAVVELPAITGSVPSNTHSVTPKHSQPLSDSALQTSQGIFIELKGAESVSHLDNNIINFNVPAATNAALAESRRVNQLLERAGQQLAKQQFIAPAGDNALDTFRQVLQLRPGYSEALEGIDTIKDHYKRQADAAARSADWEKAQALYETAQMVSSEDKILADILHQVRQKNHKY